MQESLDKIPPENHYYLKCSLSGGAILPKDYVEVDDPNMRPTGLPVVILQGMLERTSDGESLGEVAIGITLTDAKILRKTINSLEELIDPSKAHERN
jgi:hypothetical protein